MSDIIHLLPDSVANQIAAGEVVQRPASVIKELLENAIDAHATEIQIILRESGCDLIQVIDNGVGMSATDARMAFERHATSKIAQAVDLFALSTMGFRGEALASIAAVSEVELRTRRADAEVGVLLGLSGSKVVRQESVACPVGANFMVRNLFFNVPARRKFLKSKQTELSNIINELQHVALANPAVAFTLHNNDAMLLQLTAGTMRQRISQLFAKTIGRQLLPIGVDNALMSISGFVCLPESARKKGALQYFFVNDRYMRHPYFHKAVMECYSGLIPEGAQPNYFIYLKVDPATIDVNIHPTKTEIKFENESARWHILMATVREALGKYNALPTIDFDMVDAPEIPVMGGNMTTLASRHNAPGTSVSTTAGTSPQEPNPRFQDSYNPFRQTPSLSHWESLYEDFAQASGSPAISSSHQNHPAVDVLPSRMRDESQLLPSEGEVRHYLQVLNRYILFSDKQGLHLIDQRRAHANILYNQYYEQIRQRQGNSQQELFPEVVAIAPADVPHLETIMDDLHYLGFELDSLGGGSYAVNGKPALLDKSIDVAALLAQMIEDTRDEVHTARESLDQRIAWRMSLAQAIPAGKVLNLEEMTRLMEQLYALPEYFCTPEGKRVEVVLSQEELSTRF